MYFLSLINKMRRNRNGWKKKYSVLPGYIKDHICAQENVARVYFDLN